jgi:hypothetical protein
MRLLTAVAGLALSACTHAGSLNTSYFPRQPFSEEQRVDGRALVITAAADDALAYSGHPTSYTGFASTLTLPLGLIAREATAIAFADLFRDGADRTNLVTGLERYRVVVAPRVTGFEYAHNRLRNLGFAITPEVVVTLTVDLVDSQGRPTWQRSYASGIVQGDTYFISGSPGEDVSKVAHRAVYDLTRRAAEDLAAELRARSRPPALPAPAAMPAPAPPPPGA